jgi:hypothetical protein
MFKAFNIFQNKPEIFTYLIPMDYLEGNNKLNQKYIFHKSTKNII